MCYDFSAFHSGESNWDFTQIPLKVKSLPELVSSKNLLHFFIVVNFVFLYFPSYNQTEQKLCRSPLLKTKIVFGLIIIQKYMLPHTSSTLVPQLPNSFTILFQRQLYQQISRGEPLLGVNPNMCSSSSHFVTLDAERTALGEKGIFQFVDIEILNHFLI